MKWPDPSQRHCCAACRQPIADPPMLSAEEIAERQLRYEANRAQHRMINPDLTRDEIEARGA